MLSAKEFIPTDAYSLIDFPKNDNLNDQYFLEVLAKVGQGYILLNFQQVDLVERVFSLKTASESKIKLLQFQTYLFNNYPKLGMFDLFDVNHFAFVRTPEFRNGDDWIYMTDIGSRKFVAKVGDDTLPDLNGMDVLEHLMKFDVSLISYDECREYDKR